MCINQYTSISRRKRQALCMVRMLYQPIFGQKGGDNMTDEEIQAMQRENTEIKNKLAQKDGEISNLQAEIDALKNPPPKPDQPKSIEEILKDIPKTKTSI